MADEEKININKEKLGELRALERERVRREAQVELDWWGHNLIGDTEEALTGGDLIELSDEGVGYRLIKTLRENKEPKFLNPPAKELLNTIIERWRSELVKNGLDTENTFLSVSSLYRSGQLQQELIEAGNNAAFVSAHQAGAAIDFDPNGYYFGVERSSARRGSEGFNGAYIESLRNVLKTLQDENFCHVIWERGFRERDSEIVEHDSCFHVCVSPNFNVGVTES